MVASNGVGSALPGPVAAAPALDVLRALHAETAARRLPPPAALIGDWYDADAVIAPSVALTPGCLPPDDPDRFWFGYLGFPVRPDEAPLPANVGGHTDGVLVLRDGRWESVGTGIPDWVTATIRAAGDRSSARPSATTPLSATEWHAPERVPHLAAIARCLDAIRDGEVYQACVCTRFTGTLSGDPVDFFTELAGATAPAKAAFLQGDWGTVASLSPETFLRRTGNIITSSPIKGTLPAHADPDALAASAKDIAENIMIVDLVRNDLGRIAVTGSVRVPELLSVVPAPGVWHLVSRVEAIVAPGTGNDAVLAATFPPASVTGTPKLRAMELLDDWEADARGVYCGAIGMAGPDRALDLNVAIRTVEIAPDGALALGVGGGITIDSDPAREWQECLDKAASIVGSRGSA
ncbi:MULTISPECIES: aminodeoxychorismate synthase component I [unclassified Gordonia (in: high G+C Gram-positive bacteria)]|uniref:aminodeoxychorismate synthase component I n=1 Tax=Gordonia TaxID=2053 RepID=UPI00071CC962|nr:MULTISPECIES: aminodeoxychorismate synthase component I [unclassified Gordonia (in: high G+C Gram-positive bacteria)]KSU58426.1 aminodeoxychorismate synthase component I [Gordonia sp. SGD-V-85]MBR7190964.1 aminodeoxychorismate synthase component I [Gordonia sp. SCSIO 19800]MCT1355808.1 aminodeoxychorismate synthase component I [Gordonia sp. p3-SID1431]SCC19803.1 para-aminobenzoate synthetase component 1 [Gordonia sp. v-85]